MIENRSANILIVDDDKDILTAASLLLKQEGYGLQTTQSPDRIPKILEEMPIDLILLDMNFTQDVTSGREGYDWLQQILQIDENAVVILMTAYGDVDMAVKAIKLGATDFIQKPWQNEKLLATLSSAYQLRKSKIEKDKYKSRQDQLSQDIDQRFHDMIGLSEKMQQVFLAIQKVAGTDASVLILGENGTGKELVARALHRQSLRKNEVFLGVDMGAIPESLFEGELFGHVKGAFTDARIDKPGRFEVANGGTLFLDEVGNLSQTLQSKLLRVLEERQVTRLGSHQSRNFDVRLICATNMPIYDLAAQGKFRQDFIYRINTVEIQLPPLRERKEDIPLLAEHFMKLYSRKYHKPIQNIDKECLKKMSEYGWPGNVRELRHMMERVVIMAESNVLTLDMFPDTEARSSISLNDTLDLDALEKQTIQAALEKYDHNISKAAKALGLTRPALYRRMERHGLS